MTNTPPEERRIPDDCWQCCQCQGSNLLALAAEVCPVCSHQKCDYYCRGPGEERFGLNLEYGTILSDGCSASHIHGQDLELPSTLHGQDPSYDMQWAPDTSYHDCIPPQLQLEPQKEWGLGGYEESGFLPSVPPLHPSPEPVPGLISTPFNDVWTCCQCGGANLTANASEQCPVCTHPRCSQCS